MDPADPAAWRAALGQPQLRVLGGMVANAEVRISALMLAINAELAQLALADPRLALVALDTRRQLGVGDGLEALHEARQAIEQAQDEVATAVPWVWAIPPRFDVRVAG